VVGWRLGDRNEVESGRIRSRAALGGRRWEGGVGRAVWGGGEEEGAGRVVWGRRRRRRRVFVDAKMGCDEMKRLLVLWWMWMYQEDWGRK
jgi:hypothetical protein